jgi:hypothetical protein
MRHSERINSTTGEKTVIYHLSEDLDFMFELVNEGVFDGEKGQLQTWENERLVKKSMGIVLHLTDDELGALFKVLY